MEIHKKLKNQPLTFALAEFKFSPVIKMADFIPELQEALRKKYPSLRNEKEQLIELQSMGMRVGNVDRWSFISANKKSAIDINQERLVFVTAEYDRFPKFSEECRQAITLLAQKVEPGLILRIGLRYSDLVYVPEGSTISDLVDSHLGYFDCLETLGRAKHKSTETFLETDIGGLAVRTLYGNHNLVCMPDARQLPISLGFDKEASERIILDFDHFWESNEESSIFDVEDILAKLESLHTTSIDAFWKITTAHARDTIWAQ